jgi:hypothetical protein
MTVEVGNASTKRNVLPLKELMKTFFNAEPTAAAFLIGSLTHPFAGFSRRIDW